MKNLDPKIVDKLASKLNLKAKTVENNIYALARKYPGTPPNALAHLYASQKGETILNMLDKEDRNAVPQQSLPVIISSPLKAPRVVQIGKEPDRWYNNWLVQLLIGFFVIGIFAGTIAQILGIYFAGKLGLLN